MARRGSTPMRRAAALRALWTVARRSGQPGAPGVGQRLAALPRMLRLGLTGGYPHLDLRRWGLMVLALGYLVSPVDVVPELLLPVVGLGDDLFVLTWLAGAVLAESESFLEWEASAQRRSRAEPGSGRVVGGQVIERPAEDPPPAD